MESNKVDGDVSSSGIDTAAISRRKALKAATAVGVGAVAWGGPQIGVLGTAPAYAAHCSDGKFRSTLTADRNVDCGGNCGSDTFRLHGQSVSVDYNGTTISATMADKVCADVATPIISDIPPGVECQLRTVLTNPQGVPLPGTPEFPLPSTTFNKLTYSCSSRYAFRLICAPAGCFD